MKNNTLIKLIVLVLLLSISQVFVNACFVILPEYTLSDISANYTPPENVFLDKAIVIVNDENDYLDIQANFTVINNASETYELTLFYPVKSDYLYSDTIEVYENGKLKKTIKDEIVDDGFSWETEFKPYEVKNITLLFQQKVGKGGSLRVDNNSPFFYLAPYNRFIYALYTARIWNHSVSEEVIEIHLRKPIEGEPYSRTNYSELIETESEKIIIWRWENYTPEPEETLYVSWEKKNYDVNLLKSFIKYAILSVIITFFYFLFLLLIILALFYGILKKKKTGELLLILMSMLTIMLILFTPLIAVKIPYGGIQGELYGFKSAGAHHFNWLTSFWNSNDISRYLEFSYILLLLSIIPSAYIGSRTRKGYFTLISIPCLIIVSYFIYILFIRYSSMHSPLWALLMLSVMMSVYLGFRREDKNYHIGVILILFAGFVAITSGWQESYRYIFREITVILCVFYLIWAASRNFWSPEKLIEKRFLLIWLGLIIISILFDYRLGWGLLLLPVIVSVYMGSKGEDKKYSMGVILVLFAGFAAMISGWSGAYHLIFRDITVILCVFYLIWVASRNLLSPEEIIGNRFLLIWLSLIIISRLFDYSLGWQILSVIGLLYVCWILLKGVRNKKIQLENSSSNLFFLFSIKDIKRKFQKLK